MKKFPWIALFALLLVLPLLAACSGGSTTTVTSTTTATVTQSSTSTVTATTTTTATSTTTVTSTATATPGEDIDENEDQDTEGDEAQSGLDAAGLDKYIDPLPILDVTGAPSGTMQTIVAGNTQIQIDIEEFRVNMLPSTFNPGTYQGTWVWGYVTAGTDITATRDTYIGPVVVATRDVPTEMKFTNNLPTGATTNVLAYRNAIDQSLHWANPDGAPKYVPVTGEPISWIGNPAHYLGDVPAAVHLHGGEVPAAIDGGPEAWFTADGQHGPAFYSMDGNTDGNYLIYRYPNVQEAAPLWFHDHNLGATRLNVYAGLAGAYLLTDPDLQLPAGLSATGLRGGALGSDPANDTLIPLVIQDRMFDVNGQLLYTAGVPYSVNPEHQYWVPEFFGDVNVVNGKAWPYQDVEAQRYRFLMINGANARTYVLTFAGNTNAPTIWQIGTDQGYLDKPVAVDQLVIMPGERSEFILDFGGMAPGTKVTLYNLGPDEPFGGGVPGVDWEVADPETTGQVMQFNVIAGAAATDTSFNPAAAGATIRSGSSAIVRLADPATGTLAAGVTVDVTRTLTLNEVGREEGITVNGVEYEGGPLEAILNNSSWSGHQHNEADPNMMGPTPTGYVPDGIGNYLSEMPDEGTTEIWELTNLTADAHPIHTHLAQFQILNRQVIDAEAYLEYYGSLFPGGEYIPEWGPPLDYNTPNAAGALGGNPDITPYLQGSPEPPAANEAGWKDTLFTPPGMVTRFVVRWAPQGISVQANASQLHYAFVPNDAVPNEINAFFDYVWHCHILDHEDNEMMRPDALIAMDNVIRTYLMGSDY